MIILPSRYIFILGIIIQEIIRFPHRSRHQRVWRDNKITENRIQKLDIILDGFAFAGLYLIPLIYAFSSILKYADYDQPGWIPWVGVLVLILATILLWKAHQDLQDSYTPTLHIQEDHKLVTSGVYSRIRHPVYASVWLTALAQALLLGNWIAGFAGLVSALPVYLVRVRREEKLMLDHFGEEYQEYLEHTGRIFPRSTK